MSFSLLKDELGALKPGGEVATREQGPAPTVPCCLSNLAPSAATLLLIVSSSFSLSCMWDPLSLWESGNVSIGGDQSPFLVLKTS